MKCVRALDREIRTPIVAHKIYEVEIIAIAIRILVGIDGPFHGVALPGGDHQVFGFYSCAIHVNIVVEAFILQPEKIVFSHQPQATFGQGYIKGGISAFADVVQRCIRIPAHHGVLENPTVKFQIVFDDQPQISTAGIGDIVLHVYLAVVPTRYTSNQTIIRSPSSNRPCIAIHLRYGYGIDKCRLAAFR